MKKYIFLVFCLLLIVFTKFFIPSLLAQTPTQITELSPTPSQTDSDIDKIRQVVKDKVKEKIDQIINKPNQKIAWLGIITASESNQIQILDIDQQNQNILIEDDTSIINTRKQNIKPQDLKTDQIILAMGYSDIDGKLLAKRILITNISLDSLRNTIVSATVTDISQTTNTITLVTKDRKVYQVRSDKNTSKIEKNHKIMAVIKPEKKDSSTWLILAYKDLTPPSSPSSTPMPKNSE